MKKILLLLPMLFLLSFALISCGSNNEVSTECIHNFAPATCLSAKTCSLCGLQDGDVIAHSFGAASCISPKTCSYCGLTDGEKGEHKWNGTNCIAPSSCEICGASNNNVHGHYWTNALCTADKQCLLCGEKQSAKEHSWSTTKCLETPICLECNYEGIKILHNWEKANCISAENCTLCGEIKGEPLGHDWLITSCDDPKVCKRCNESAPMGVSHEWIYKGCYSERICKHCSLKEGFAYGHSWIEASCLLPKYCENCEMTVGSPLGHKWKFDKLTEPLCEEGKEVYACTGCDQTKEISTGEPKYGYHVCDAYGFCSQCGNQYDTEKMALDSLLISNVHSLKFSGVFTSEEATVKIYKPISSLDVGMPIVDLGGALPTSKGYANMVDFTYDSDELSFVCTAEIKVQGASSAGYPKKNFNIKLFNDGGSKYKVELVDGWGKENKYCMKANYIDYSQARNVISGKIFGEIVKSRNDELSDTPNGGAIDGYPILVYNDGVYQGIYTMNIPKDKWMLDMHDSEEKNQAIIMANTWNQAVSFREISTSGFVVEYVSNEDSLIDNSSQWALDSLLDLIEFVYNNDGEDFKNGIHEYADIDKCIDSMLYTFFICADDNTSKNILWVTLDGKVWFSSMYDMDGTWGMRWNGRIEFNEYTHPISALVDGKGLAPERNHSHLNLLWEKIYINYFDRVCERYLELRQEILTEENITNHFEAFFNAIPDIVREAEKKKWTGVPSQDIDHLEQILNFARKRLIVMDDILLSQK